MGRELGHRRLAEWRVDMFNDVSVTRNMLKIASDLSQSSVSARNEHHAICNPGSVLNIHSCKTCKFVYALMPENVYGECFGDISQVL